jgi:hypothetical protein
MHGIPSPALRHNVLELFGDHGADTLDRYFAQIEYTAVWCARMLDPRQRVRVVIPEAVEDLVVIRRGRIELRQVKSRNESVGAWSLSEVLPILASQYARSYAFGPRRFSFHFVSDARADVRVSPRLGSLEALKDVLDLRRRGMKLRTKEATTLRLFLERLPAQLVPRVKPPTGESCNEQQAEMFLLATHIDTNDSDFRTPPSIELLHAGLRAAQPMSGNRSVPELQAIYDQILLLIVRRIREGGTLNTRAIRRTDVLQCCETPRAELRPDFRRLYPDSSLLEAKTLHGGFDPYEAKQFRQQLSRSKVRRREIAAMRLGDEIDDLDLALGELQRHERRCMTAEFPQPTPFGPVLLERVRPQFAILAAKHLSPAARPDALLCQGILWEQTQACRSAWHPIENGVRAQASVLARDQATNAVVLNDPISSAADTV